MAIEIIFETHSWSEDNENGAASGWQDSPLSARGRTAAQALGARRRADGLSAVFASDLNRAAETARIVLAGSPVPLFCDWRLRECDYGEWNGLPAAQVHGDRARYLDQPYPGGESWRQAVGRVGYFLGDLHLRWQDTRVLVIGHVATRWAFEHFLNGIPMEELVNADFVWQEGWIYRLK